MSTTKAEFLTKTSSAKVSATATTDKTRLYVNWQDQCQNSIFPFPVVYRCRTGMHGYIFIELAVIKNRFDNLCSFW